MPFAGGLILISVGLLLRFGVPDPDVFRVYQPVGLVFLGFGCAGIARELGVVAVSRGFSRYLTRDPGRH